MRLLVCGGRDCTDQKLVSNEISAELGAIAYIGGGADVVIIHGGAKGADYCAGKFAEQFDLECEEFHADWKQFGRAAGHVRNAEMLKEGRPSRVLAFWDGKSKGTLHMVTTAAAARLSVRIVPYTKEG